MTIDRDLVQDAAAAEGRPSHPGDWVVAALLLVAGAAMLASALADLEFYDSTAGPGAGFFPVVLGGVLAVLAAVDLERTIRRRTQRFGDSTRLVPGVVVLACAMAAVTIAVLTTVGFDLALGAFLLLELVVFERLGWRRALIASVLIVVAVVLLFEQVLGVPLPSAW
jgi:Tripartite tricarboxylate transporter TctB family